MGDSQSRTGNRLLRGLSVSDQKLISAGLRPLAYPCGAMVIEPGDTIESLYFPETGFVVVEEPVGGHGHVEVAIVGNEGLIGWPALLGSRHVAHRAVVRSVGTTLHAIDADTMLAACRSSRSLGDALLTFVQAVTVQMSRSIVSHVRSSLDQRIARWLLMRHDRIVGDQIIIRHEQIADGLNARRASVTTRLHVIEGERLISSRRGRIVILDRPGLEAFAGDAFGVAEAEYRRLLGKFGKS